MTILRIKKKYLPPSASHLKGSQVPSRVHSEVVNIKNSTGIMLKILPRTIRMGNLKQC